MSTTPDFNDIQALRELDVDGLDVEYEDRFDFN